MIQFLRQLFQIEDDPMLKIVPPVYRWTTFDPALRERTAERRKAADAIRTRACAVEAGAKTADVLRLVK